MSSFWLLKSEPSVYSIDDLKKDGRTSWEGVRNYQARNFLRDSFKIGDEVLFYHSNAEPPCVTGIARVVREGYPDPGDEGTPEKPVWFMVDVAFVEKFRNPVSLEAIKRDPQLSSMMVAQKGSRLSVQPVKKEHFERLKKLGSS